MATKPNHALIYRRVPPLLRLLRTQAGLTQVELAARIKKQQAYVSRCEAGTRRIDVAEWVEWCWACGADPKVAFDALSEGALTRKRGFSAKGPDRKP